MSKEITKAKILQEIQDKFELREFEASKFLFDETVIPVYNIEQHLRHWEALTATVNITEAAAHKFFTVPASERWFLRAYNVTFLGAGAHTVAGLYINRKQKDTGAFVYLDLSAGQTISYLTTLPEQVTLEPDDEVFINIDGYTSTQGLRLDIDVQKEEIR